jgi:hypothetical protein
MEEDNEYGNCWEDLMRRIDAENRVADAKIRQWQVEEEERVENGEEGEMKRINASIPTAEGHGGDRRKKKEWGVKGRTVKEKTGAEMHKMIAEKEEKRNARKAKTEARKMIRKGKMKTLDRYFNRRSKDSDC